MSPLTLFLYMLVNGIAGTHEMCGIAHVTHPPGSSSKSPLEGGRDILFNIWEMHFPC